MNSFFRVLGVESVDSAAVKRLSLAVGIPEERLHLYNETNTVPTGGDLAKIKDRLGVEPTFLMLSMGCLDRRLTDALQQHATEVYEILKTHNSGLNISQSGKSPKRVFRTGLGELYQGDCLDMLASMPNDSVDLVFADPPFNLRKLYPSKISDDLREHEYLTWCEEWGRECARILKPGASFLVWNLPKWNTHMAGFLNHHLTFRHWISVDIKYRLPIAGRLYPSHYALLYYCKGEKPSVFHPDRLPMEVCPNCSEDLRDYGGYKDRMNPAGINLTDIWFDIAPVRHAKYKKRKGANELPVRLLDRVIEMASNPGNLIFDPFGGAGTTYIVSEIKQRRWIGVELGPVDDIISRFASINEDVTYLENIRRDYNHLFTDETLQTRKQRGLWTAESVRALKESEPQVKLNFEI